MILFSCIRGNHYYIVFNMKYFMWNLYTSSVKKGQGLLHAGISSIEYKTRGQYGVSDLKLIINHYFIQDLF